MAAKDKNYLSTREAALQLNVAVSTVQTWTDNGLLHAWTTAGGHRRIEKASVEKLLKKKASGSTSKNKKHVPAIVVVEDNEQDLHLYQNQFEEWGMELNVNYARDGFTGLLNIGKTSPGIIITDLIMPGMDGFELIKAIKTNVDLKNTLIVVVSALSKDEINSKGGLSDDIVVFEKPIKFDDLHTLIREKLGSKVATNSSVK